MAQPLLAVDGIEVRRGMNVVLKDFNLTLKSGEVLALVGENGAGKSTLLEACARLLPLEQGRILHADVVVADHEGRRRPSPLVLGLALQKNGMMGSEFVAEHLATAMSMSGHSVDPLPFLRAFSLEHRANDLVAHLSQGQARKVAVLAALLPAFASKQPGLVLLDEPAAGMDEHSVSILCEWIAQLRILGHAVMICTHDQRIATCATTHIDVSTSKTTETTPNEPTSNSDTNSQPVKAISPAAFGWKMQWRTLAWLNHNAVASLLTLGILLSFGDLLQNLEDMQRYGFLLAPAFAAGLCGEAMVQASREERTNAWWRAVANANPHSGMLPLALGCLLTLLSSLSFSYAIEPTAIIVGGLLTFLTWHTIRLLHEATNRLARPRAVFVGLLTPTLILPYALLLDLLSR